MIATVDLVSLVCCHIPYFSGRCEIRPALVALAALASCGRQTKDKKKIGWGGLITGIFGSARYNGQAKEPKPVAHEMQCTLLQ